MKMFDSREAKVSVRSHERDRDPSGPLEILEHACRTEQDIALTCST